MKLHVPRLSFPIVALFVLMTLAVAEQRLARPAFAVGSPDAPVRWRPPVMREPTGLTATASYFAPRLRGGRDYRIVCPRDIRNADMLLAGDPDRPPHNIVLVGCRSRGRLIVRYFSGVAHIEGTWWSPPPGKDGIDCGGPAAESGICRIQNTRVTSVSGSVGTVHADCLQPWGRIRGFQIDRFTCDTNYQGEFLAPTRLIGFVDQSRSNLRHNDMPNVDGAPGVLFWIGETDQLHETGRTPVALRFTCRECYARVRPDLGPLARGIYPAVGTTLQGRSVSPVFEDGGLAVCWPALGNGAARSAGRGPCRTIVSGDPPKGDFAPASLASGYIASGYRPLDTLAGEEGSP